MLRKRKTTWSQLLNAWVNFWVLIKFHSHQTQVARRRKKFVQMLQPGEVLLLQNTRYEKGEEKTMKPYPKNGLHMLMPM